MITRPKGEALVYRRDKWNVVFYENGVKKMKSLSTDDIAEARIKRDEFFLNVEDHTRRSSGKYVYYRKPWQFRYKGKVIAEGTTRKAMEKARDEYFNKEGSDAM